MFLCVTFSAILNAQKKDSLANTYLVEGEQKMFYGKYHKSILSLEKALTLYKKSKNQVKIVETYNALSKAYWSSRRMDKALFYAQEALSYSRSKDIDNKKEEAKALHNFGLIYSEMRQLKKALENYEKALQIRLQFCKNDSINLAASYFRIGVALHRKRDLEKAMNHFQEAKKINPNTTPESKVLEADVSEAMGYIHYDRAKYDEALSLFEKTLSIAKEVYEEETSYFSKIYNDLGLIYSMKEQLNESLKYYKKALSVNIQNYGLDKHPEQIKIHYNIGTIYNKQGLRDKALFHTKKTLNLAIMVFGENHPNLFFPYSQLGQIYGNEEGIPYIEKALAICEAEESKNLLRISFLYDYLSLIYTNIENDSEALKFAEKALKIRKALFGENNENTIRSYNIVSKAYFGLKDYHNAIVNSDRAIFLNSLDKENPLGFIENFETTGCLSIDMLLESIKVKADSYLGLYEKENEVTNLEKSALNYKKAIGLIDLVRQGRRNYDDKIKFSEIIKSIFSQSIRVNILLSKLKNDDSYLAQSFYSSEKSRANVLRELAKNADVKKIANVGDAILKQEKLIESDIARLRSKVIKEISKRNKDSAKLYALEGQMLDLSRRRDSLENSIELNFPKYHSLKYEKNSISIIEIQDQLDETTTLIEFFKGDETWYVFVITKTSFNIEELKLKDVDTKVSEINNAIITKDKVKYTENAHDLYKQLIVPIEQFLTGDKLIIIPDESLWHLQFDLLVTTKSLDGTKRFPYFMLDYAISYANSASLLFEKTKQEKEQRDLLDQCIAFSYSSTTTKTNNNETISLTELRDVNGDIPGTRKEIQEISKVFDGKYYYNQNANEANFKEYASKYKIVHLAMHGEIDDINPKNSKIYFSENEAKNEDNKLFSHELYSLDIPASLVVLSACNTGSGKVNKGEGILSLGNAFQYAGAESLLLSRWKISDKTTPEIMKLFYQNLKNGMNKSKALQKAKIDFLTNTNHFNEPPFYWGSFYILGDIDPISFSEPNTNIWMITGVLLLLVLWFIYRKRRA